MKRKAWTIAVERLASLIDGSHIFDLQASFFEHAVENPRGVYEALYTFLKQSGCEAVDLHNRTFVGRKTLCLLDDTQRKFLSKRGAKKYLDEALAWSSFSSGPHGVFARREVVGHGLCVLPSRDNDTVEKMLLNEEIRERSALHKRQRAKFESEDFYHWLVGAREHDDYIGDLASEAYRDHDFPRRGEWEDYDHYLNANGWTIATEALDDAWIEYLACYPDRATRTIWCDHCKLLEYESRVLDESDLLIYSQESGFRFLHAKCVDVAEWDQIDHSVPLSQMLSLAAFDAFAETCGKGEQVRLASAFRHKLRARGFQKDARRESFVYFIRAAAGDIKIGVSNNVASRLASLQTAHPAELVLLAKISGGRQLERDLHERFVHLRKSGEWFDPHPDLLAFISSLPDQ